MNDFYTSRPLLEVVSETLITVLDEKGKEFKYTACEIRASEQEPQKRPVNGKHVAS